MSYDISSYSDAIGRKPNQNKVLSKRLSVRIWVLLSISTEVIAAFFVSDWILDQIGLWMPNYGVEWLMGISALTGGLLGLAQLLLLRLCLIRMTWIGWMTWTIGAIAGAVVRWYMLGWRGAWRLSLEDSVSGLLIGAVIAGAFIGISQWLVLRQHVTGAWWLVLANIVALTVGLPLWVVVADNLDLTSAGFSMGGIIARVITGSIEGVVFGGIVGGIMARILRGRTIPKKAREGLI